MTILYNQIFQKEKRIYLRKNATKGERLLWWKLKNNQLGVRFRRQYGIGNYIVDFYCPALNLVIELDGITHDSKIDYDINRQRYLESKGVVVLRFTEENVRRNLEGVVGDIVGFYSVPLVKTVKLV